MDTRVHRDINNYAQEHMEHLIVVDSANASLRLEMEAGRRILATIVKNVSEN